MMQSDLERTPSKKRGSSSDLMGVALTASHSHSSLEVEGETPESAFQSAYTAPPYPRPQADRNYQQESITLDRERGDLTAHNLELIPNADQVAPGIRLDRGGNDYLFHNEGHNEHLPAANTEVEEEEARVQGDAEGGVDLSALDLTDKKSLRSGKATSSIDATGRSSTGINDMEGVDGGDDSSHDLYEDVGEGEDDDVFDEKNIDLVHERVGGSGATPENASKGTSVGHFGPLGEAIRE
jgi:hypothetical protein